jgi:hypothetical protein
MVVSGSSQQAQQLGRIGHGLAPFAHPGGARGTPGPPGVGLGLRPLGALAVII